MTKMEQLQLAIQKLIVELDYADEKLKGDRSFTRAAIRAEAVQALKESQRIGTSQ